MLAAAQPRATGCSPVIWRIYRHNTKIPRDSLSILLISICALATSLEASFTFHLPWPDL